MISTYDDLSEVKNEIGKFVELVNGDEVFNDTHILVGVTKYILFYKQIQLYKDSRHYVKSMMYDLLTLIHTTTQTSLKNFYSTYRSLIENYVRFILDIDDTDDTGVRNIFNKLNELCDNDTCQEIRVYIEGEYGKCCDYVHSNVKAKINLYEYYEDILQQDELSNEIRIKLLETVSTFLKNSSKLTIQIRKDWVDNSFYKEKQKLKYLLNKNLYDNFIAEIN